MARDPRYFRPNTLVEVTTVTQQNRFLLRPSEEVNDLALGVWGRAQRMLDMPIVALAVLSSHYHALLVPRDPKHLADFMEFVNGNVAKEIGRVHGWEGHFWHDRYHLIPVSDEEETQVSRLRYLLSQGVKENLVDRVEQWPGVHSATALIQGNVLTGHWYDRKKDYAARVLRGEKGVDLVKFAREESVVLSPLPCWAHFTEALYRAQVARIVADIDETAARERRESGKKSLGVRKILNAKPTGRSQKDKTKTPKPRFHAIKEEVIERLLEAYKEVIQAYRLASARLREGDLAAEFPEGTFPPALPFVPFAENLTVGSRGQPF